MTLEENVRHGKVCEAQMIRHVRPTCATVERMHRGADLRCTAANGQITFHEAKYGGSQLTPYQKGFCQKALKSGQCYVVHRCRPE